MSVIDTSHAKLICCMVLPMLLSGCMTGPIPYDHRNEQIRTKVEFDPNNAVLFATSPGESQAIVSSNEVMIQRHEWKESEFVVFPFPLLPNYIGSPKAENITPKGIYARWPSGATAEVKDGNLSYYSPSLKAEHPDRYNYNSRRLEYDKWIAGGGKTAQTVIVSARPESGMISFDGTNYYSSPLTGTCTFIYSEYEQTNKHENIYVKWPSGTTNYIDSVPIAKYGLEYGMQPRDERISVEHPYQSGKQYAYDCLASLKSRAIQPVIIQTKPASGLISFDGQKYISSPATNSWPFAFEEFEKGQKIVTVYAKWPSGVSNTIKYVPIETNYLFPIISHGTIKSASTSIKHPYIPASKQYEYDSLGLSGNDSSPPKVNPRWVGILFDSNPKGAKIYAGDILFGVAPVEIGAEFNYEQYVLGLFKSDVTAVWDSQAKKDEHVTFPIQPNMAIQPTGTHVFQRPVSAPGVEIDLVAEKRLVWKELISRGNPNATLSVTSDPDGATLYIEDKQAGQAPTKLSWGFIEEMFLCGSTTETIEVTARWPSGATKTYTHKANLNSHESYTFIRPIEFPKVEVDVQYALELAKLRENQRRAEADAYNASIDFQMRAAAARAQDEARAIEQQREIAQSIRESTERSREQSRQIERDRQASDQARREAAQKREYENQQLLNQQRDLAEKERANRVREQQERNKQTLDGMKALTDQLNRQYPVYNP